MVIVDLAFLHDAFPLDWQDSLFIYLVKNMIFRKYLEAPLIFVLFFKGKQNEKENPKCDSLFGKDGLLKTKIGYGDQVTY